MVALASTPPVAARAARRSAFSLRETFVSDKDGDGKVDLDDIFHGETEESYSLEKLARQVEARRIAAAQAAEEVQRESLQKAEQRRLKREALEAEVEERRRSLEARRAADAHEAEIQAATLLALSLSEEAKQRQRTELAVSRMQAHVRRRQAANTLALLGEVATVLQSGARGMKARIAVRPARERRRAASICQKYYRRRLVMQTFSVFTEITIYVRRAQSQQACH